MITASLLRRRSRMLIALLSIAVGATILSGLVTIYYDVPRQMGAQFRSYGANMILLPGEEGALTMDRLQTALEKIPEEEIVGATPYRYVRLDMPSRQQSFISAGTDFNEVQKTSPYFSVDGAYPEGTREILVGKEIAETLGLKLGSSVELSYKSSVASGGTGAEDREAGETLSGSAEGFNKAILTTDIVLDEEGRITSIEVDASGQTPDIGSLVGTDQTFLDQFIGKKLPLSLNSRNTEEQQENGQAAHMEMTDAGTMTADTSGAELTDAGKMGENTVDAVTGATISSQAVVDAVNSSVSSGNTVIVENTEHFTVSGILSTGGEEEAYIYMSLHDLQRLTADETLDVAELSVSAGAQELEDYSQSITDSDLGVRSRLVKRVTRSEASVLGKLQALVFLVTVVVLLLTMICVSTTMLAVVSERRREIGLRKALGASDASIRKEFLGEGMFLGGLGGILGTILGFAFAQVVSIQVFGSSITFQPLLLPATILISMAIAAVSCQLPIKRAVAIDPAIVLKGE